MINGLMLRRPMLGPMRNPSDQAFEIGIVCRRSPRHPRPRKDDQFSIALGGEEFSGKIYISNTNINGLMAWSIE